jgi:folylpolyglutamate synthase/dihydropteroate synthase
MKQVENIDEWYSMLDEIEQASMPSHIDMMAQLHDLEVQTEGRVQVIHITKTNPRG